MANLKYEKYVYRFAPDDRKITWDSKAADDKSPRAYFRGACQIPGSKYNIGYGLVTEACMLDSLPHKHEADEYLLFGSETLDSKDFDAEIELTIGIGEDAETYIIDRPASVFIPAGIWHGPLNFKRVGKPVFFQPALQQESFSKTVLSPEEAAAASKSAGKAENAAGEKKYEKLVYFRQPDLGTQYIDGTYIENTNKEVHGVGFRGGTQILGAQAYIGGGLTKAPVFIDPYPHRHEADEYLAFLGAPTDPFDFQAHVELTLGLGEDAETYNIDQPTIVRIPAGTWHCPLNFIRIDKPIFFQVSLMQSAFYGTYMMPDGMQELWINGDVSCSLDPTKRCTLCRRCLALSWQK